VPTYEYECRACGHTLEAFQSFSEKPLRKCPRCRKMKLQRLIGTGAGFIFKGSGFYETDYRSKEYKEKAKKESGESGSSGDSKSSDSDSSSSDSACGSCKASDCPSRKK
jgi:putative FmdB family regulatory protein